MITQRSRFALVLLVGLSAGCAGSGAAPTVTSRLEDAPSAFVEGTRVLAVVYGEYTREEIFTPTIDLPLTSAWRQELNGIGVTDADIADGSEIYASSFFWSMRSRFDVGDYMAHVDATLQGKLHYAFPRSKTEIPKRMEQGGDIAEIELSRTASGKLAGRVVAIYREQGAWRDCRIERVSTAAPAALLKGVLNMSIPVGGWIECDGLEAEGWVARPVEGQPLVTPLEGRAANNVVREWIKLPTTGESP